MTVSIARPSPSDPPNDEPGNAPRGARLRAWLPRLRLLCLPAAALVVDLASRFGTRGNSNPTRWSGQDASVYALGVLWSFAAWLVFHDLLNRVALRAPRLRKALVWFFAIAFASAFLSSFAYRLHFDQSPSWQVLKWSIAEWKSVFMIGRWVLGWTHLGVFIVVILVFVAAIGPATQPWRIPERLGWRLASFGVLALWLGNGLMTCGVAGFQDPLPVEANSAAAITQLLIAYTTSTRHLVTPVRPAIPPQPQKPRPNVLVLMHESLRADVQLPDLGYLSGLDARQIAPFSSTVPDRRAEGYRFFPRARTNSTATESSVPTVLSGVDPGGATDAYGRATSIWAIGKAVHASTFLFSAQSYSFSHFDEFFCDSSLDIQRTGEDLSKVLVNDRGIDDGIAVEAAIAHMRQLVAQKRPFVGVVHFNGTHSPGWPGPDVKLEHKERSDKGQYAAAARYIDKQVERLANALKELGIDDDTIVLNTSDHGENIEPHHPLDRLGAFYEECTRIPIWLKIPPRLLQEHPEWEAAFDAWHLRNVQNLDTLPTLRDLIGLAEVAELGPPVLGGRSIVRPPPSGDDMIMGQSTCSFRAWALDGFYVVNGRVKFIASNDQPTPQIYDLDADVNEARNLWNEPGWRERVMPWVERAVLAGEERKAVCKRIGAVCPVRIP